ncbi:MAG: MBL fold metallo-hydrolase [bacterium]
MQSTIHFFGGAGTVTGSNFLLDTGNKKILIDCGLFQGDHVAEVGNWEPFPFDPKEISVLINTHAHIDHIGRIPKLVKEGFRGKIISTEATKALALPMLMDAMALSSRTAEHLGKEPLYEQKDIDQAMRQWEGISYHQTQDMGDGVSMQFLDSGHILGSAMAEFTRQDGGQARKVVFTGDLGGGNSPLLPLAEDPQGVNYLLMESVYGDRVQSDDALARKSKLEDVIEDTAARGGTLLIPAFSTERTQDLLFDIRELMVGKRVPSMPVYLDSPLAEKITAAYLAHPQYFSKEIQARIKSGEHIFSFTELHFVESSAESEKINATHGAKIIIAGSGMSNGGRVQAHEKVVLPDANSTLLIVGYQAAGSMGRRLAEGVKSVSIRGAHRQPSETVHVACRVETLYGYSAHMDGEQLLEFANKVSEGAHDSGTLKEVFVVMGEPASAGFLAQRIRDYLSIKATTPHAGEKAEIEF